MVNKSNKGKFDKSQWPSLPLFSEDDCPESLPAAGYRNEGSHNNQGSNGNYWSSTANDDTNNAYNLNFNSGNHNVDWNNRNNGRSVRPVSELTKRQNSSCSHPFSFSKHQLLKDLLRAYKDARKNKRNKRYQLEFEYNLEENLVKLRDELWERRYLPQPCDCFIIHDPKMREVFAAQFRDRIVHHLFYNYTYAIYKNTFIYDSYSCIEGRGTHFGIERLKHHIRSVSRNYQSECYVLKIDLKGYFMSINRDILMRLAVETLYKNRHRFSGEDGKLPDYEFVMYLLRSILETDPTVDCNIIGDKDEWNLLPEDKSLFTAWPGCGLPIGNLSSQLFSNVYLNKLDQFAKRELKCCHYGRYVDDIYVVDNDKKRLKRVLDEIRIFLDEVLNLKINEHKTRIINASYGVEFLGAYVLPYRTYISNFSKRRIIRKLRAGDYGSLLNLRSSINSFLGVFSHYKSYCLRKVIFTTDPRLRRYGNFSNDMLRYIVNC